MPPPDQHYSPWEDGAYLSLSGLSDDDPAPMREEAERIDRFIRLTTAFKLRQSPRDLQQHYTDARAMLRDVNGVSEDLTVRQAKWQILLRNHLAVIHMLQNHPWRTLRNVVGAIQAIEELEERGVLFRRGIWRHMKHTAHDLYRRLLPLVRGRQLPGTYRSSSPLESSEEEQETSEEEGNGDSESDEESYVQKKDDDEVVENKIDQERAIHVVPSTPSSSSTRTSQVLVNSLTTSMSSSAAPSTQLQTPLLGHSLVPKVVITDGTPESSPIPKSREQEKAGRTE